MKKIDINTKGITLIALIITIIILIILAGVSIISIFGSDGLLERVKKQKIEQTKAQILEQLELAKGSVMIDGNGYTNLTTYLQSIENTKLANTYEVTKVKQIDEANALIWVDNEYQYIAAQIGIDVIINSVGYMTPTITSFTVKSFNTSNIEVELGSILAENYEFYIGEDENNYQKVYELKSSNTDNNKIETITYNYDISDTSDNNKTYYLKAIAKNSNGEDSESTTTIIKFKDAFSGSVDGYSSSASTNDDTYFPLTIANGMDEYFTYSNNIITFKKDCKFNFSGTIQATTNNTVTVFGYYLNKPRPTTKADTAYYFTSSHRNNLNIESTNFSHTISVKANDYIIITWKAMDDYNGCNGSIYKAIINLNIKILEF